MPHFVPSEADHNKAAKAMRTVSDPESSNYKILKDIQLSHYHNRPAIVSQEKFLGILLTTTVERAMRDHE